MHFELTIRPEKALDKHFSYGLVFIPCPVWVKGDEQIINLNPSSPEYHKGSIKRLIEKENLQHIINEGSEAVLVVNDIGHGTEKDLTTLKEDLVDEGFRVKTYGA